MLRQRAPRLLLALAALAGAPAGADIYGYVDERGVAHLSNTPLDHRFYLFKRERRDAVLPGSNAVITSVPAPRRTTRVNPASRRHFAPLVSQIAKEYRIEPALLHAVVTVESGYNPNARSPKGAAGVRGRAWRSSARPPSRRRAPRPGSGPAPPCR